MPPQQQRLIFSGRQMCVIGMLYLIRKPTKTQSSPFLYTYRQDDKMASDFGIQAGAVLHLVLALRGGGGGDVRS